MESYIIYHSPIGILYILADELGITRITTTLPDNLIKMATNVHCENCVNALSEYFDCKRSDFTDVAISPTIKGTDFQKRVWNALTQIPMGMTASYIDIAIKIKSPQASRAVGGANHNNPIPIIVPCHRVIGKNGTLTGYALGLDAKKYLLELEQEFINKESI